MFAPPTNRSNGPTPASRAPTASSPGMELRPRLRHRRSPADRRRRTARRRGVRAARRLAARREDPPAPQAGDYDLGKQQFNTVASATMKMLNASKAKAPRRAPSPLGRDRGTGFSIICCACFAAHVPHISHALWRGSRLRRRHPGRRLAGPLEGRRWCGTNRADAAGERQAARRRPRCRRRAKDVIEAAALASGPR